MCRARHGGPRTPSKTADADLDCASVDTPEFFLLPYQTGFTVASMIPFLNRRSKENSSPMSISALVVAFVTFVFGLCFVYL